MNTDIDFDSQDSGMRVFRACFENQNKAKNMMAWILIKVQQKREGLCDIKICL